MPWEATYSCPNLLYEYRSSNCNSNANASCDTDCTYNTTQATCDRHPDHCFFRNLVL